MGRVASTGEDAPPRCDAFFGRARFRQSPHGQHLPPVWHHQRRTRGSRPRPAREASRPPDFRRRAPLRPGEPLHALLLLPPGVARLVGGPARVGGVPIRRTIPHRHHVGVREREGPFHTEGCQRCGITERHRDKLRLARQRQSARQWRRARHSGGARGGGGGSRRTRVLPFEPVHRERDRSLLV